MAGRQCLSTEPEVEVLAGERVAGRMAVAQAEPEPEAGHMLVDDMQAVEEQRLR